MLISVLTNRVEDFCKLMHTLLRIRKISCGILNYSWHYIFNPVTLHNLAGIASRMFQGAVGVMFTAAIFSVYFVVVTGRMEDQEN